jgi:hypothetical protein
MRPATTAVATIGILVCLGLLAWVPHPAASQATQQTANAADASTPGQSEAAEKHAKLTACLKDAKSQKLVGAQKTAFVKECMAANPPARSSPSAP